MVPSVTTNLLRPLPLADAIMRIGEAGFRAVEVEKAHVKRILASDDVVRECERVRATAQESGVRLVQLHATFGISTDRPPAETVRLAQDTLRVSGQLGVEWEERSSGGPLCRRCTISGTKVRSTWSCMAKRTRRLCRCATAYIVSSGNVRTTCCRPNSLRRDSSSDSGRPQVRGPGERDGTLIVDAVGSPDFSSHVT